MDTEVELGDLKIQVVRKDIKNVHLSVYPPTGAIRISAPLRMELDAIRAFALTKLGWIKDQQKKLLDQDREPLREFLDRESHYVWGQRYLLRLEEIDGPPKIELGPQTLHMKIRPGTSKGKMAELLEDWYRDQLRDHVPELVAKWESLLGLKIERVFIQQMKTKWGSSSPESKSIRLNTELARKPLEFLEYVIVHELMHFLAPTHGAHFKELMDRYLPNWRQLRDELNRLPLRQEIWS